MQSLSAGGGTSGAASSAVSSGFARRGHSTGSTVVARRNAAAVSDATGGGKAGNSSPNDCPVRQQYAVRAAELPKIKGVFIGKKHTCWVAQWNDANGMLLHFTTQTLLAGSSGCVFVILLPAFILLKAYCLRFSYAQTFHKGLQRSFLSGPTAAFVVFLISPQASLGKVVSTSNSTALKRLDAWLFRRGRPLWGWLHLSSRALHQQKPSGWRHNLCCLKPLAAARRLRRRQDCQVGVLL